MSNTPPNQPGKARIFLILAILSFSVLLALYWSIRQQGIAAVLIGWQVTVFGGYYVLSTFALTWLALLIPCLPLAFILGKLCDRLGL